jgi:membrane protein DedA with SNARE-associated domain
VHEFLSTLLGVPAGWLLAAVAALVFVEDALFVGFVVPGETAAVLAGAAASLGRVPLVPAVLVVAVAAVTGDAVGYLVGRRFGDRLLTVRPLRRHSAGLERGQRLLRDRGGVAVFLARFTAFLRAVTPALAGASRMPYGRFAVWNVAGGVLWATAAVLVGWAAGTSYTRAASELGQGSAVVVAVVVAAGVVVLLVRRHRAQPNA